MAPELLFDTDVFIDHLRGARTLPAIPEVAYSILTRCELFSGDEREEPAVQALLAPHVEIEVDRRIAERAGRLGRISKLDIADAVIAASALERGLALVTRNRRDFERVPDLELRDPAGLTRGRPSVK